MAARRKNSAVYWWIGALFAIFAVSGIVDQLAGYIEMPKWWAGYAAGGAGLTAFWLGVLFSAIRLTPRSRSRSPRRTK